MRFWDMHQEIRLLGKDETYCDMIEKNLDLKENGPPRNYFKKEIGADTSCEKRGRKEIAEGSTMGASVLDS